MLEPRPALRDPELVSDGGGLPFAPASLAGSVAPLDPEDRAVEALMAQIRRSAAKNASRASSNPEAAAPSLDGWRLLARADDEVLFGRGRPPQLLTVSVRKDGPRGAWICAGASAARPLRATRDGIRASGWRPDLSREFNPEEAVLRVLITEQTWAGGQRADRRLLAPDLHASDEDLMLTMFVTPRGGFQVRSPNPVTPARIVLPHPVGPRRLIDGARYNPESPDVLPTREVLTDSL